MAIFQRVYQGYSGELSSPFYRPWVIFRYAIADVFSSRIFAAFFTLCFVPPLALMCVIYMRYNLEMMFLFDVRPSELLDIDAEFFAEWMQMPQMIMAFVLIMLIGPALISPDLRNNALPLYLSRPINKPSYIFGKLLVLLALGSLITWIPGLLLILLQAYLAEGGWLINNLRLPMAAIASALVWIVCLSMMALAISACVKWKVVARLFFFGLVFLGSALAEAIHAIFGGWVGSLVSLSNAVEVLVMELYGVHTWHDMPVEAAAMVFLVITLIATVILTRRIRAVEIVR